MTTYDGRLLRKKLGAAILAFVLSFALLGSGTVYGISLTGQDIPGITDIAGVGTMPELTAQSAILIDADTGQILYEKDVEQNGTVLLPGPVRGEIEFRHVSFAYAKSLF